MTTPPLAVSCTDVRVTAGGADLLAPTSFDLPFGGALAVTGSNGSGKTTLLRVLADQLPATSGHVRIAGAAPDEKKPAFRRDVAALLGLPPLARNLTLREHLALVAASWGSQVPAARAAADDLLEEFEIAHLSARFPGELSSGQTQLFGLSLVFARPARLLLLDEPEQRLDADRLDLVGRAIGRRVTPQTALVMASHSPALVAAVCDRTVHLVEAR